MNIDFRHSALIEKFLSNEMSETERTIFKAELESDKALANEFLFSQSIDSAIAREDVIDLRKKLLAAMGKNQKTKVPVFKLTQQRWWLAAASLLILVAIGATIFLQSPKKLTDEQIFKTYYSSENVIDITRGDASIVDALVKFQQKDFNTSSNLFSQILEKDKSNMAVWFYYGIANIEIGNFENARKSFNTIIDQNDNLYIEHAEWYLALCNLKAGQKAKAIEGFRKIASDFENYHQKEALAIIEKMQLK